MAELLGCGSIVADRFNAGPLEVGMLPTLPLHLDNAVCQRLISFASGEVREILCFLFCTAAFKDTSECAGACKHTRVMSITSKLRCTRAPSEVLVAILGQKY